MIKIYIIPIVLLALLFSGCSVNGFVPMYAKIDKIDNPEYPYRLKLYTSEHINFNVHQLSWDNEKYDMLYYIILKQSSGNLTGTEFMLVEWTGIDSSRNSKEYEAHLDSLKFINRKEYRENNADGKLEIKDNNAKIELTYIIIENGMRRAHPANGMYRLLRN